MRLLLVEDDQMLADGIKQGLTFGWRRCGRCRGQCRIGAGRAHLPSTFDAAIIDVGLPQMDGMALTERMRERGLSIPVLMLTARDSLDDRVQGLDAGADDDMVKPFELPELLARLRALLRRSQAATSSVLTLWPHLALTPPRARLMADEQPLDVGPREWTVLQYLMLHAPKPVSKEKLLQALTGWDKENHAQRGRGLYLAPACQAAIPDGIALRSIRVFGYRIEQRPE